MLDIDPVRLTCRGVVGKDEKFLHDYVNDRPYAASSHLAVAIAQVYRTAMSGRCNVRPELAGTSIPLTARVESVRIPRQGELSGMFLELLGYTVNAEPLPLDENFPDWGDGPLHNLTVASGERTLAELLRHLHVLLPVLDNRKHYWIGEDELEKLVKHGEGWLESYPMKEMIAQRYPGFRRGLTDRTREMLAESRDEEKKSPMGPVRNPTSGRRSRTWNNLSVTILPVTTYPTLLTRLRKTPDSNTRADIAGATSSCPASSG